MKEFSVRKVDNYKLKPIFSFIFVNFYLGILQIAIKESRIEKNLKDIQQQWDTMRFQLHKHFRPGFIVNIQQEHSFIITDVDDILQAVEDSTLLLNSMQKFYF